MKARAARALATADAAEAALLAAWKEKGFAALDPGETRVGCEDREARNPPRSVSLKPFALGLREVTCAEYAEFVQSTRRPPPPNWTLCGSRVSGEAGPRRPPADPQWKVPEGCGDLPVTLVSAEDALAYCEWLGKKNGWKARLPSEDEWEVAAGGEIAGVPPAGTGKGGTSGSHRVRKYPWGETYEAGAANLAGSQPVPAGTFPRDCSPCGCLDMAGNVCEWCLASVGAAAKGGANQGGDLLPAKPEEEKEGVGEGEKASPLPPVAPSPLRAAGFSIRGGCFDDGENAPSAKCAFRQEAKASRRSRFVGFRVLVELE